MGAIESSPKALPRGDENLDIDCYELDFRQRHGIETFLYWFKQSNILTMALNDFDHQSSYYFEVPNNEGLDAIYHPFIYKDKAKAIARPLLTKMQHED